MSCSAVYAVTTYSIFIHLILKYCFVFITQCNYSNKVDRVRVDAYSGLVCTKTRVRETSLAHLFERGISLLTTNFDFVFSIIIWSLKLLVLPSTLRLPWRNCSFKIAMH